MAEAAAFDLRRTLLIAGVLVVVIFPGLFFLFRCCAPGGGGGAKKSGYTTIYSDLELKDAANAIARLKELALPYEIRDDGRSIAVPKEKADQARLGLAEKNLPVGGVVGWEIFNEARLGATDFDRRIQLIRAISGELSRTIRRIAGVEDVRVQVVIPETKLFAATTSPVTASVMLRLRAGVELESQKINGIVHLVASSVENLQPENVMVVDDSGKILTARGVVQEKIVPAPAPTPAEVPVKLITAEAVASQQLLASPEVVLKKEVSRPQLLPTGEAVVTTVTTLTAEERILLKLSAKKNLEQELSGKAQDLLNRFYPINSVVVKVGVDIKPARDAELKARDLKIKKIHAIVLVDNRIDLSPALKQATFTTIAAAVGYHKGRGDTIILQRVPFHLATPPAPIVKKEKMEVTPSGLPWRFFLWGGGILLAILIAFWGMNVLWPRLAAPPHPLKEAPAQIPFSQERVSRLDEVKSMAAQNPEQIAQLLKRWLGE
jgi:flagellar M-ring protein FliF